MSKNQQTMIVVFAVLSSMGLLYFFAAQHQMQARSPLLFLGLVGICAAMITGSFWNYLRCGGSNRDRPDETETSSDDT
ncbi:hypothetical protein [Devosia naphthalenivorans]|uniref:hypothetical protein n=1 Tax=Devosia naphthalenivorans TaxID=2082392 RepID=UPI000D3C42D1|nr:hypothetical protein [Devosia naphthalenivorans]